METRLGYNERKFIILSYLKRMATESKYKGATAAKIARDLGIDKWLGDRLLRYYYRLGYLVRVRIKFMPDPITGKKPPGREPYLYRISEKGLRWLDRAEALVARGFGPRPGKYTIPEEGGGTIG